MDKLQFPMDQERGTGRSTQQMLLAPDRFFFVVGTWGMLNHARTLQRKHVSHKDVTIITIENLNRLTGTSLPVVVDHDVTDRQLLSLRDQEFLLSLMNRNNP